MEAAGRTMAYRGTQTPRVNFSSTSSPQRDSTRDPWDPLQRLACDFAEAALRQAFFRAQEEDGTDQTGRGPALFRGR
jgi:hypothetical protein